MSVRRVGDDAFDDAFVVRDFGRIVGAADLVVEQFAADVAHECLQLRNIPEEFAALVEHLDPLGQRTQQCLEIAGTSLVVRLLCHGIHLALPSVIDAYGVV